MQIKLKRTMTSMPNSAPASIGYDAERGSQNYDADSMTMCCSDRDKLFPPDVVHRGEILTGQYVEQGAFISFYYQRNGRTERLVFISKKEFDDSVEILSPGLITSREQ